MHLIYNWLKIAVASLLGVVLLPCLASGQTDYVPAQDTVPTEIPLLHGYGQFDQLLPSVATIGNQHIVSSPPPSFLQALPGKLAGLYTRQRSGVQDSDNPESVIDFRIRGQIPLILVDGVPRQFASIEPESIESITVLKDAMATVLYGQRSSGNIILVTTRRPAAGPFKLSATAQYGTQRLLGLPETLSAADYAILYNEARANDGQDPVYSAADIINYREGADPYRFPDVNWYREMLRDRASISRYNVNLQSGNEHARFYVALDYMNEGGFLRTAPDINTYNTNTGVDRYIIRSNVSVNINQSLVADMNIFGRVQSTNQPGGTASAFFTGLLNTPSNAYPMLNEDGTLGGNTRYSDNLYGIANYSGYRTSTARDLAGDFALTQRLDSWLDGLWTKASISYTNTVDQTVNRSKSFAVFSMNNNGTYQQIGDDGTQGTTFSFDTRNTFTYGKLEVGYERIMGENSVNVLLLADQQRTTYNLDLPATYTNYALHTDYQYKGRYMAEAAVSYGGFNRFRPGQRFGFFYAAAVGWNLAREPFLADAEWINLLKPRISYGHTGNANVGYYVYDQYYEGTGSTNVYYFGATATGVRGFNELALANDRVSWEKANKLNVGIDGLLFNNQLQLSVEYFNEMYYDLMQTRGTSMLIIGQSYPTENIGKNRYTGFEGNVSWRTQTVGRMNYFVDANASVLQSNVLYQDEVFREYDHMRRTGLPVGQPFGYVADGFYNSQEEIDNGPSVEGYNPVPGDLKYSDINGDGFINQYDEVALGRQKPLVYFGLTAGIRVAGFDLTASVQGVANRDIILSGSREFEFMNNGDGQAFQHHLYRWTPRHTEEAQYPRLSIGTNVHNQRASSFWVESADYIRLQNVSLGYTLPASLTQKMSLSGIRFFATGFNLIAWHGLDHNDPENNNSVYPLRRTYTAGISINL